MYLQRISMPKVYMWVCVYVCILYICNHKSKIFMYLQRISMPKVYM